MLTTDGQRRLPSYKLPRSPWLRGAKKIHVVVCDIRQGWWYVTTITYHRTVNYCNIITSEQHSSIPQKYLGRSGGAKVLVNVQCRGVLLIWIIVGQGPITLPVGAGGIFSFSLLVVWLCWGCRPFETYCSLYRAVSQREGDRKREMIDERKNVQTTPPAPTASTVGPCLTLIQIRRPALEVYPAPSHQPTTPFFLPLGNDPLYTEILSKGR